MVDHKAQAEFFTRETIDKSWPANVSLAYSAQAQAHATLHLAEVQAKSVEQQRVANLIAAAQLILTHKAQPLDGGLNGWAQDSEDSIHGLMADEDFWVSLMGEARYAREKESWKHD